MCERIAARSAVQKHILDHVRDFVELNPVLIDGVPHRPEASGSQRTKYVPLGYYWRGVFYVCPRSGLLRVAPRVKRPRKDRTDTGPDVHKLGDRLQARRIDGLWYFVTLAEVPTGPAMRQCRDVILRAPLSEVSLWGFDGPMARTYGTKSLYGVHKRQMSKKEIRKYIPQAK